MLCLCPSLCPRVYLHYFILYYLPTCPTTNVAVVTTAPVIGVRHCLGMQSGNVPNEGAMSLFGRYSARIEFENECSVTVRREMATANVARRGFEKGLYLRVLSHSGFKLAAKDLPPIGGLGTARVLFILPPRCV